VLAGPDTVAIRMGAAERARLDARERGEQLDEEIEVIHPRPEDPFDLAA
jgi:hypothetical protein